LRSHILGLAMALAWISAASADPPSFRAGVTRMTVQDATPFDVLIAYPTDGAEVSVEEGPFSFSASRDAPIAPGARFPVVLFSHGGGRRQGRRWVMAIFCFTSRGKVSSSSRHSIPQPNGLSSIGRDIFTRRSILCWRIHAFPTAPIPTGSA
jgi:hypothetical protein